MTTTTKQHILSPETTRRQLRCESSKKRKFRISWKLNKTKQMDLTSNIETVTKKLTLAKKWANNKKSTILIQSV